MNSLAALCELEVRHLGRDNRAHQFKAVQLVADAVEQPLAAAEQRRRQIDLHLVHQPGGEVLLRGTRSAGQRDVLAARGAPRYAVCVL